MCFTSDEAIQATKATIANLKKAVAAGDTYSFDHEEVLAALVRTQPLASLEAIFPDDGTGDDEGLGLFDHILHNPVHGIPIQALITWCEQAPTRNYPLAAQIVEFANKTGEILPDAWSEAGTSLLRHCPDQVAVLRIYIQRFRPMSWSGSRAAIMEANAQLLAHFNCDMTPEALKFADSERHRLTLEIAEEREWEAKRHRLNDERFE